MELFIYVVQWVLISFGFCGGGGGGGGGERERERERLKWIKKWIDVKDKRCDVEWIVKWCTKFNKVVFWCAEC